MRCLLPVVALMACGEPSTVPVRPLVTPAVDTAGTQPTPTTSTLICGRPDVGEILDLTLINDLTVPVQVVSVDESCQETQLAVIDPGIGPITLAGSPADHGYAIYDLEPNLLQVFIVPDGEVEWSVTLP